MNERQRLRSDTEIPSNHNPTEDERGNSFHLKHNF